MAKASAICVIGDYFVTGAALDRTASPYGSQEEDARFTLNFISSK